MLFAENSAPPLGLGYLSAYLEKFGGYETAIADLRLLNDDGVLSKLEIEEKIKELIDRYNPRIIGISSTTQVYNNVKIIVQFIKNNYPEIILVAGGVHPTFTANDCLDDGFDFVVRFEGEKTTLELVDYILKGTGNIKEIKNVVYKNNGRVVANSLRPLETDLDSIPFPNRKKFEMGKYIQKGALVSSRGCPMKCIFCSCGALSGNNWRTRSVENILKEIEELIKEYNVDEFFFHDDTFTFDNKRVRNICSEIIKRNLSIKWGCQARVDSVSKELLKLMYDAGCRAIQFGVESGNQGILNKINKNITLDMVRSAVKNVKLVGIDYITCSFIIGHPEDDEETILDTINFMFELGDLGANTPVSILTPFPGTEVYNNSKKYGIKFFNKSWSEALFGRINLETKNLSKEKLEELYDLALSVLVRKKLKNNC
jgi:radical SAM superfamily enzyme YgiQ (UPF0313 family)